MRQGPAMKKAELFSQGTRLNRSENHWMICQAFNTQ